MRSLDLGGSGRKWGPGFPIRKSRSSGEMCIRDSCLSIPEGERLAEKTFNPRLGIEGGLSILGTTGIVEPMSRQALIETIRLDIRVKRAAGAAFLILAPGNYGLDFLEETYGIQPSEAVKCSNYIGEALDCLLYTSIMPRLMIT